MIEECTGCGLIECKARALQFFLKNIQILLFFFPVLLSQTNTILLRLLRCSSLSFLLERVNHLSNERVDDVRAFVCVCHPRGRDGERGEMRSEERTAKTGW